jgi:hypothetical protein
MLHQHIPQQPEDKAQALKIAKTYFQFKGAHLYLRNRNYSDMEIDVMFREYFAVLQFNENELKDDAETMRSNLREASETLKNYDFPASEIDDLYDQVIEVEETADKDNVDEIARGRSGKRNARRYLKKRGYSDFDVERLMDDHIQMRSHFWRQNLPRVISFGVITLVSLFLIYLSIYRMEGKDEYVIGLTMFAGGSGVAIVIRNVFFHSW